MAELADAPDLGSGGVIHAGSIPVTRTKKDVERNCYSNSSVSFDIFSMRSLQFAQDCLSNTRFINIDLSYRQAFAPFSQRIVQNFRISTSYCLQE